MEIKFYAKVLDSEMKVRNIALLLEAFTIIRDGINIMINGDTQQYLQKLQTFKVSPNDEVRSFLARKGKALLKNEADQLSEEQRMLLIQLLLEVSSKTDNGLGFVNIKKGSLEGIIEESMDNLIAWFKRILNNSSEIIEGDKYLSESIIVPISIKSLQSEEIKEVGAGITLIGVLALRKASEGLKIKAIEVSDLSSNSPSPLLA